METFRKITIHKMFEPIGTAYIYIQHHFLKAKSPADDNQLTQFSPVAGLSNKMK